MFRLIMYAPTCPPQANCNPNIDHSHLNYKWGRAEHNRQDAETCLHTEHCLPCGSVHDLALYGDYLNNICTVTED